MMMLLLLLLLILLLLILMLMLMLLFHFQLLYLAHCPFGRELRAQPQEGGLRRAAGSGSRARERAGSGNAARRGEARPPRPPGLGSRSATQTESLTSLNVHRLLRLYSIRVSRYIGKKYSG